VELFVIFRSGNLPQQFNQLAFSVELNYVGTSFGNLPSFSQFSERLAERSQSRGYGQSQANSHQQSSEIAFIKWQQKIPQPSVRFLVNSYGLEFS
jgi:hypothetical protein